MNFWRITIVLHNLDTKKDLIKALIDRFSSEHYFGGYLLRLSKMERYFPGRKIADKLFLKRLCKKVVTNELEQIKTKENMRYFQLLLIVDFFKILST